MRTLLVLLLAGVSLYSKANDPVAVIPFRIINEHIHFEMAVNDSKPLHFIFDTGAAGNVMSDKTAEKLSLEMNGSQAVQGASGATMIERTTGHSINVQGMELEGISFMVMDLDHLADEDSPLDGIIGATFLNIFTLELNYDESVIKLYKKKTYTPAADWEKKSFSLRGFNIPIVSATITMPDGEAITGPYLVDTGAALSVKFNTPFVNKNELIDKMGRHYAYSSRTLSKTATDQKSKLPSYKVFGHEFKNISVRLSQGTKGVSAMTQVDGILGLSILKRFNVVYDYYNQTMYLKPSKFYDEPFHFNYDGMKIEKKDGAFEVTDVFNEGPAQKAGIQTGDIILSIDGRKDFERHEFHHYFEKASAEVQIVLTRDGKEMSLKVKPARML